MAQKKAEAQRMMHALSTMDTDFEKWMAQMLLDHTKAEVSQMILSKANKKHAAQRRAKAKAKTTTKKGMHKFIKATYRYGLGWVQGGFIGCPPLIIEAGSPAPMTPLRATPGVPSYKVF